MEDCPIRIGGDKLDRNGERAAAAPGASAPQLSSLGLHRAYVTAALIGAILIAAAVVTLVLHSRAPAPTTTRLSGVVRRSPQPIRPRSQHAATSASAQLRQLLPDRRALRSAVLWAMGNWAFDAASLWVFLAALRPSHQPGDPVRRLRHRQPARHLPVSPGGLGVNEGVLIASLVGFGAPRAVAVFAVVSWRLLEFWAPIPAAGICYLSLRSQRGETIIRPAGHRPSV